MTGKKTNRKLLIIALVLPLIATSSVLIFCFVWIRSVRKSEWWKNIFLSLYFIILYLSSASYSRSSGAQPDMMNQVFEKLARTVFV